MTKLIHAGAFVACLSFGAGLACTVQQTASPGGADAGTDAATAGTMGGTLSCLAILQCVADCPDSDVTCADTCVGKGSDGQAKAGVLATCIDAKKCTEETCLRSMCGPSLDACVNSSTPTPTGTPLQGTAPAGSVPTELVGSYARANYGQTTRVGLNANGTGTYQTAISSLTAGCTSTSSTSQTGNAVVTGTTITIYATEATTTQKQCSAPLQTINAPQRHHAQRRRLDVRRQVPG